MFKKADKNELRTWCLGSLVMFVLCVIIAVSLFIDVFTKEFDFGTLALALGCSLVAFLFCKYMINSFKAYKTFDERKEQEERENVIKEEEAQKSLAEKIRKEKEEMEAIRLAEEKRDKNNALELEQKKKEALENEKKR